MKVLKPFTIAVSVAFAFVSCKNFSKEQRVVNKLEGNWSVKNIVLPINGKDSSLLGNGNWIDLRFDDCPSISTSKTCSMALTVKVSDKAAQDVYMPIGYMLNGKEEMKMLFEGDTLYFKIDGYKKGKLKLSGTDASFSAAKPYVIEAEKK